MRMRFWKRNEPFQPHPHSHARAHLSGSLQKDAVGRHIQYNT